MALRDLRPQPRAMPQRKVWHGYLLSQAEQQQIDCLMGKALLDPQFCERLLRQRESVLGAEFCFSKATREWLCSIEANSLKELAQAVTAA